MAKDTRHVVLLVLGAREAGAVRIAARTADAVASDAELLAGAAVAARARHWIDASLLAVLAAGPPTRRVRVTREWVRGAGTYMLSRVALDAGVLAVACHAEPRVSASLEGMARHESRAMQTRERHRIEREPRGERGHRADAVASRA